MQHAYMLLRTLEAGAVRFEFAEQCRALCFARPQAIALTFQFPRETRHAAARRFAAFLGLLKFLLKTLCLGIYLCEIGGEPRLLALKCADLS